MRKTSLDSGQCCNCKRRFSPPIILAIEYTYTLNIKRALKLKIAYFFSFYPGYFIRKSMADTLKDIPEFFETELGESIIARTDALGETYKQIRIQGQHAQ